MSKSRHFTNSSRPAKPLQSTYGIRQLLAEMKRVNEEFDETPRQRSRLQPARPQRTANLNCTHPAKPPERTLTEAQMLADVKKARAWSPIIEAINEDNFALFRDLLASGADTRGALHFLLSKGRPTLMHYTSVLLNAGVDTYHEQIVEHVYCPYFSNNPWSRRPCFNAYDYADYLFRCDVWRHGGTQNSEYHVLLQTFIRAVGVARNKALIASSLDRFFGGSKPLITVIQGYAVSEGQPEPFSFASP